MMIFPKVSFLAALVASCLAIPTLDDPVVHERRSTRSNKLSRVGEDTIIPIRIGLAQSNLEHGYQHLMDVSHPLSSRYGQHWTSEEVENIFAPSDLSAKTVREWLIASGINPESIRLTRNKGWLAVDVPAHQAEALLNAEYHEYETSHDGAVRLGCDSYSLPRYVSDHVDFIRPGIALSPPVKKTIKRSKFGRSTGHVKRTSPWGPDGPAVTRPTNSSTTNCGSSITPDCIKALYDIPDASSNPDPANALGVFEEIDIYAQEDLDAYFAEYLPDIPQGTHPTLLSVNGASAPIAVHNGSNAGESDVDLDMAYSLIYPQKISLYQVNDVNTTESSYIWLDSFLDAIDGSYCTEEETADGAQCGVYDLTRVTSISYTTPEISDNTPRQQQRACNEILKLGMQGKTIVISSGDYGVAAHPSGGNGCADSQGNLPVNGTIFNAQFPGTCPWVLAVGATQLDAGQTVNDPESVMYQPTAGGGFGATFTSSGGFANYFDAPDYQSAALQTYFAQNDPGYPFYQSQNGTNIGANGGIYNRGGRGIPDVSANGAHFLAFNKGALQVFHGTSLAAPLWASLIVLVNDARSAAGKGPVGFINPVLYEHPEVFNDITKGSNPGCNTQGFPAVEGWDPATGLGTPRFPALMRVMMELP